MFGNNSKYAVFGTERRGTAPGFYFSKGGYISATGAIEINRDTVEILSEKRVSCLQNYLKSEDV